MSFKSYRNSQSKFRRSNRRNVSAQTESCELRSLLSASAITVSMDEAAPCETTDAKVNVVSDDSGVVFDDSEVTFTVYDSLKPDATDDGVVIEELVVTEDQPPIEGWDPSWLYRSFAGSPEGAVEDAVIIDDIMLEDQISVDQLGADGLGCGVAPEGFVPGESIDSDGDGLPDDFVMYPFDPIPVDQLGEDGLGCGVAPDGFVPGESIDSDGDGLPDDFVMYQFDPLPVDQLGEDGLGGGVAWTGAIGDNNAGVNDVDLYKFVLDSTQAVTFTVTPDASADVVFRLFDSKGDYLLLMNVNDTGVPESFTETLRAGTYYLGVSSSGNLVYTPADGLRATRGETTGQYTLEIGTPDGLVPFKSVDSDADGLPDDFMIYPDDPLSRDPSGDDGLGGFVPGDVPINDVDGEGLPDDFVMYPFDPIPVDQLGEDGLGCGVAPDGFVPGESVDSDGDGFPDDFVMYPYDPIPVDQLGEDGLGCGVSPEGFVPGESVDSDGDGVPDDLVTDPVESDGSFDPRILMTYGGGPAEIERLGVEVADGETEEVTDVESIGEVFELGEVEFLGSDSDDSLEPQVRFLRGSEVQRTLSSSSALAFELPVVATAAPEATTTEATTSAVEATTSAVIPSLQASIATNAVPVRQASSNSLFSAPRDKSTIGVALTSPSGSGTVGGPLGTKSSSTPKRSKSLLQTNSNNSKDTSALEDLSPLTGDEADSPELDSAPGPQDPQVDEQIADEPSVSSNENVDSRSNAVVKNTRRPANIRPGMIDEVMSQYSENSYNA